MAVDPNIALQAQGPKLENPLDASLKAMNMQNLMLQNRQSQQAYDDDQAVRSAFKNNMTTDDQGNPSVNRQGALGDIMKVNPTKALDYQKLFQGQDLEKMKRDSEVGKQLAWSVSDDSSYQVARQKAMQMGLPNADKLPEVFSPSFVQNWQLHSLEGDKQLEAHMQQQNLDLRSKENDTKVEANRIAKAQANDMRIDKLTKDMKKDLDADAGKSGNFGVISAKVQGADRLKTLIDAYPGGNLPSQQMEELALGMANMLSNSTGAARSQVEALVPHTLWGKTQDVKQWLLNDPQGAQQQAFVKQMAHTIDRERQTANDQLNQIRTSRLSAHGLLKKLSPDSYNGVLQGYQYDPKKVVDGRYKADVPPPNLDHLSDDQVDNMYSQLGGK